MNRTTAEAERKMAGKAPFWRHSPACFNQPITDVMSSYWRGGAEEDLPQAHERLCIAPAQRGLETARRTALVRPWKSIFGMRGESSLWSPVSLQVAGGAAFAKVVEWSVISPMPAYSRTAAIPATASVLVVKGLDTAITVPSGAVRRNLKADCASINSSNIPPIAILSVCGIHEAASLPPEHVASLPALS